MDAEWQIIYEKLEKCVQSGASIILSKVRWCWCWCRVVGDGCVNVWRTR